MEGAELQRDRRGRSLEFMMRLESRFRDSEGTKTRTGSEQENLKNKKVSLIWTHLGRSWVSCWRIRLQVPRCPPGRCWRPSRSERWGSRLRDRDRIRPGPGLQKLSGFFCLTCRLLFLDGWGQGGTALHSSRHDNLCGRHADHGGSGRSRGRRHGNCGLLNRFLGGLGGNGDPAVLVQLPLHRALYLSPEGEEQPSANQLPAQIIYLFIFIYLMVYKGIFMYFCLFCVWSLVCLCTAGHYYYL